MLKVDKKEKIKALKQELKKFETKLAHKMRGYRGVIHESAQSELRHSEVMVLRDMVRSLKSEIAGLEEDVKKGE